MQFKEISLRISSIVKKYWLPLCLGLCGILFILYGLISLVSNKPKQELQFADSPQNAVNLASESAVLITVDVEGAVASPGVYKLKQGSIIEDALAAAKGLSKEADKDFVSKNINLAAKLSDTQKIYIPKAGEELTVQVQGASTVSATGLININTASSKDLDSLPGVGPITAGKIIAARPFTSIEELLSRKLVSAKVFEEIKDKITAY